MVGDKLKNKLFEEIKDRNLLYAYTDGANASDELGNNYDNKSTWQYLQNLNSDFPEIEEEIF